MADPARYRFGPLERRGLLAGWRGGQIASVAVGVLFGLVALHTAANALGALAAAVAVGGGVALACWPVGGRTAEEWLPTVVRWEMESGGRSGRTRSAPAPGRGHRWPAGPPGPGDTDDGRHDHRGRRRAGRGSAEFEGLEILEVRDERGTAVGVVKDRRAMTYTAVVGVRGHGFALFGREDKERRVAGWAAALAALGREGSVVQRIQWLAGTVPDDGRGVDAYFRHHAEVPEDAPASRSYAALLGAGAGSATRHGVLVAVQVDGRRARRAGVAGRRPGDRGPGSRDLADRVPCGVLLRELASVHRYLADADLVGEGALDGAALAGAVRDASAEVPGDGGPQTPDEGWPPSPGAPAKAVPRWPWPLAVRASWDRVQVDATAHAVYWIAEWPRVEVGPDFLAPLLLGPVRRSVSVVMEPVAASRAVRQVEQARTADLADSELRRRGGFLATARRAREADVVARREDELAEGHVSFRFTGYVTVTAGSGTELEEACVATEQAAGQAHLELRRLYGDQERAFACGLPLCRGLA
jgi:hypothetical protein